MAFKVGQEFIAVKGDEKNGFYPVKEGQGTHYYNGLKIVRYKPDKKPRGRKGKS